MITVKVARLGTAVVEVALADDATVQDALTAAGLAIDGNEELRINSESVRTSDEVEDGDIVTLVPKVKGGQKVVKVARLGSAVVEVAVDNNATVQDALDAADVVVENEDVRIDGSSVSLSSPIGEAALITIVPKVKGGK
jgi:putative ubiquitin-RnfH superfamily antitoxin RatB of RatAB toxin-antitoxin module